MSNNYGGTSTCNLGQDSGQEVVVALAVMISQTKKEKDT